ncbi:hypothetical protein OG216_19220 [Streptomycetaceae bacterium NBC_01309]
MRVGITGHRGLAGEVAEDVRQRIQEAVRAYDPSSLVGVSCIADGPDAWFARAVLQHGGELDVVIPAVLYRDALPEWHHPEYDSLFASAARVHSTGMYESTEEAHMAGSEVMVGLVDELLAVWDGQPARGYGGTADVVAYATDRGVPVRVLWSEGAVRD